MARGGVDGDFTGATEELTTKRIMDSGWQLEEKMCEIGVLVKHRKRKKKRIVILLARRRAILRLRRKAKSQYRRCEMCQYYYINAPKRFCVSTDEEDRGKLLTFIHRLREATARPRRKICLNFCKTTQMFTCGTLVMYAELRNILNSSDRAPVIRMIGSRNTKVMQVLKQVGILSLLGFRNIVKPSFPDVVNWKFTCGNNVDGSKFDHILEHLNDVLDSANQRDLYIGFSEALANTHEHAYISVRPEGGVERGKESWWAFSQIKDGQLHVVFCDLGIGIPKSLPTQQSVWNTLILSRLADNVNDGAIIREAIAISKSRTNQPHRGKGLGQFLMAVKAIDGAYLSILSNCGGYRYERGEEKTAKYKKSVGGTLIEWKLPLHDHRGQALCRK